MGIVLLACQNFVSFFPSCLKVLQLNRSPLRMYLDVYIDGRLLLLHHKDVAHFALAVVGWHKSHSLKTLGLHHLALGCGVLLKIN